MVHQRLVGRGQRVGEQRDAYPLLHTGTHRSHADRTRHEVRRHDADLTPRAGHRVEHTLHRGTRPAHGWAGVASLFRCIGIHLGAAGDQRQTAAGLLCRHRALAKGVLGIGCRRRCGIAHRRSEARAGHTGRSWRAEHVLHRPGEFAVPVVVEGRGQLPHHRARGQHVQVDEVGLGVVHEVFVA